MYLFSFLLFEFISKNIQNFKIIHPPFYAEPAPG